jgi:hypothetical protein
MSFSIRKKINPTITVPSDIVYSSGLVKNSDKITINSIVTTEPSTSNSYKIKELLPSIKWDQINTFTDDYESDMGITSIKTDGNGNIYISGNYDDTVRLTSKFTVQNTGTENAYVAKLDYNHNWLWVTQLNSTDISHVNDLDIGPDGSIYVGGYFGTDLTLGNLTSPLALSLNGSTLFVAKLDNNGKWVWNNSGGGVTGVNNVSGLKYDHYSDGVIVGGNVTGDSKFDGLNITSPGTKGIFGKISANGDWMWVDALLGGDSSISQVGSDKSGNVYAYGTLDVIVGGFSSTDLTVAKIDFLGNFLWTRRSFIEVGDKKVIASSIVVDDFGNTYFNGFYTANTVMGNVKLLFDTDNKAFIAKLDTHGVWSWVHSTSGTGAHSHRGNNSLTIDKEDNTVYMVSDYTNTISFGHFTFTSQVDTELCIAKLDTHGRWLDAISTTSSTSDSQRLNIIHVSNLGEVYFAGSYKNLLTLGEYNLQNTFNEHANVLWGKINKTSLETLFGFYKGDTDAKGSYGTANFYGEEIYMSNITFVPGLKYYVDESDGSITTNRENSSHTLGIAISTSKFIG